MTDVRTATLEMERIDTHGHLGLLPDDLRHNAQEWDHPQLAGPFMQARVQARGCHRLYGIDPGVFFNSSAPAAIFQQAQELRAQGPAKALERAFDVARIRTQLVFRGPLPGAATDWGHLAPRVAFLAYIDPVIAGDSESFSPDFEQAHPDFNLYHTLCRHFAQDLPTFDHYLDALDQLIDGWPAQRIVGMKTAFAYTIGLSFANPTLPEARAAFAHQAHMTRAHIKTIQDFAFRHALRACLRNHLPVVIHTGFQIWGHADLAQSNPLHLHNLLIDPAFRDLPFVLLHGGQPYCGETTYLASMFPNVYIDFTWLSWMSRVRFRAALAEWLEVVPPERFVWGSDSGGPEAIAGIDAITREEIAGVLETLIRDRIMDEKSSLAFLDLCYLRTPRKLFHLDSPPTGALPSG